MVTIGELKTIPAPETANATTNDTVGLDNNKAIGGEDDNSQIVETSSMLESVGNATAEAVDINNYTATSKGNRRGSSFGW